MDDENVRAVERAMVAIRRSQSRRRLGRLAAGDSAEAAADLTAFPVLDALQEAAERGESLTLTALAARLDLDPPRASRLVTRSVDRGLVRREADPDDRRRAVLALTGRGLAYLEEVRRGRRAAFARAMAGWSEADRAAFARLLGAFVAGMDETGG
jgi:DNA-binding MarR family transcriptional regulator